MMHLLPRCLVANRGGGVGGSSGHSSQHELNAFLTPHLQGVSKARCTLMHVVLLLPFIMCNVVQDKLIIRLQQCARLLGPKLA